MKMKKTRHTAGFLYTYDLRQTVLRERTEDADNLAQDRGILDINRLH